MFVGREKEINELQKVLTADKKAAVLIYGKRRVGKSYLITEVLKTLSCKKIYYECLDGDYAENLQQFTVRIRREFENPYLSFSSFQDAFDYLSGTGEQTVVVLDEYSYLKGSRENRYVDSVFRSIIDSMGANIRLVLIGSFVSIMQELLERENPLFGRFSLVLHLRAFDYYVSSQFYPQKNVREKIEFYSIFGGNSFVNAMLDPRQDLRTNICEQILNPNSAVRSYLENILLSELSKTGPSHRILTALSNSKKKYSEIAEETGITGAGTLDKQLKNLIQMDVIQRTAPINRRDDRRKIFYEITDNLVRFYYTYVYAGKDTLRMIGEEAFYDLYILPSLDTFISHRFEEIAREYFQRIVKNGKKSGIYDIGTYWYDDPVKHVNGEFDCVLKHKDTYSFYEVKYHRNPLDLNTCREEEKEVRRLAEEFGIEKIGFICSSGFAFSDEKYDLITAEDMYREWI